MSNTSGAARIAAPEDIKRGDVVAVLHEIEERVPFITADDSRSRRLESVKVWMLPGYPRAYRVLAVSLPFVLVEENDGDQRLLDVRQMRIARLNRALAASAFPRKKSKTPAPESEAATPAVTA